MSLGARLVIGLVLLLGAALFVVALTAEEPEAAGPASGGRILPERIRNAPKAKPGILDSQKSCKGCHPGIYAEWRQDWHAKAWVDPLYTEKSKQHKDPNCVSCHAPRPILETGLDSPAEARANYREEGITCLTCHKLGDHVAGPTRIPKGTPEVAPDCGPVFEPRLARAGAQAATTRFCGVCHNLHGTDKEFQGSRYYREGKSCLSCHMERIVAPVAKGGKPRARMVHRFPGAHSRTMLRRAMALDVRKAKDRYFVRVVNRGAGHRIPTDARHRAIWLTAAFFDAYGQPVPVVVNTESGERGLEKRLDLIRLFYRQEQREPTQIDPAGTPGKDNWRESSVRVPPEARGGTLRLRIYFLRFVYWPLEKGTIVVERKVKLDG